MEVWQFWKNVKFWIVIYRQAEICEFRDGIYFSSLFIVMIMFPLTSSDLFTVVVPHWTRFINYLAVSRQPNSGELRSLIRWSPGNQTRYEGKKKT
jgi:hypothetical protein